MEIRSPTPADRAQLAQLFAEVAGDGEEPLSEFKFVRVGSAGVCEMVAVDREVTTYVQAAWHGPVSEDATGHWAVELATIADGAVAADTIRALVNRLPSAACWVFWGRRSIGIETAQRLGLVETRAIHRMEVAVPLPGASDVSDDVRIAGLRIGRDEEAWIATNNAAFAGHPENGGVTPDELATRFSQGWFDAQGIRMAWTDGRLVGSCWTKVHPDGVGEIYIVGVHPDDQGSGLGRVLVVEGLRYLAEERGVTIASLWVEDVNVIAARMYENLGFVRSTTIHQFEATR